MWGRMHTFYKETEQKVIFSCVDGCLCELNAATICWKDVCMQQVNGGRIGASAKN